jgi:hypothetical protein
LTADFTLSPWQSPKGKKVWNINETFETSPDYVIIELENGFTLYCRADNDEGSFVFRKENCYRNLDDALTRRITLTGCLNATYTGYRLERKAILIFEFRAANKTTCVNESVEVKGRLYDVLVRIETENGTVKFPVEKVKGSYLTTDEIFRICGSCGGCDGWHSFGAEKIYRDSDDTKNIIRIAIL